MKNSLLALLTKHLWRSMTYSTRQKELFSLQFLHMVSSNSREIFKIKFPWLATMLKKLFKNAVNRLTNKKVNHQTDSLRIYFKLLLKEETYHKPSPKMVLLMNFSPLCLLDQKP